MSLDPFVELFEWENRHFDLRYEVLVVVVVERLFKLVLIGVWATSRILLNTLPPQEFSGSALLQAFLNNSPL